MEKSKRLINPTTNKIQISGKRDAGFYIFLSKLFLMTLPEIELHALGDAITTGVKVAESLSRFGYTEVAKINTTTISSEDDQRTPGGDQTDKPPRRGKKAKLIIVLKKSSNFDTLIENFKIQKA